MFYIYGLKHQILMGISTMTFVFLKTGTHFVDYSTQKLIKGICYHFQSIDSLRRNTFVDLYSSSCPLLVSLSLFGYAITRLLQSDMKMALR